MCTQVVTTSACATASFRIYNAALTDGILSLLQIKKDRNNILLAKKSFVNSVLQAERVDKPYCSFMNVLFLLTYKIKWDCLKDYKEEYNHRLHLFN